MDIVLVRVLVLVDQYFEDKNLVISNNLSKI